MLTQKTSSVWNNTEKMSRATIEAYCVEFPWLREWVEELGFVERIYVEIPNAEFLRYEPRTHSYQLCIGRPGTNGYEEFSEPKLVEMISMLDKDGGLVVHTVPRRFWWPCRIIGRVKIHNTISHALEDLGESAERVHFILSVGTDGSTIVYKPPSPEINMKTHLGA